MAGLLQDVRFALRQLRKNPGFTITATAMLTVAICANSTVFSWINGTMLHPIPGARDTGSLVSVMRGEWNPRLAAAFVSRLSRSARPEQHPGGDARLHPRLDRANTWRRCARPNLHGETSRRTSSDLLGVKPLLGASFFPKKRRGRMPFLTLC